HVQHPPESFGDEDFQNGKLRDSIILSSKRTFRKHGQSGLEVSDLLPHIAEQADELAVIRSCYHEGFPHSQAQFLINNGWPRIGRPSLGSWILYGLGAENQNLPGFVVLLEGGVRSGPAVYGQGFLPAAYQGTSFRPGRNPILNLSRPAGMQPEEQRDLLDTLRKMNEQHLDSRNRDSELADLKSRGLLDSTLVIWGGEFGRSPTSDGGQNGSAGRDHNPYGFTLWMAGGGVKGGKVIGSTDELGLRAVEDRIHLNDLHASILGLLGLDHTKLTYPYLGRDFRLTDVAGNTDLMDKLRKA